MEDKGQIIYVLMGIPGSGKTTWARKMASKDNNTIIVSNDDIRFLLKHDYLYDGSEKQQILVRKISDSILKNAIEMGYNIIIDQMSLTKKSRMETVQRIRSIKKDVIIYLIRFEGSDQNLERIKNREMKWGDENYYKNLLEKLKNETEEVSSDELYDKEFFDGYGYMS